jgi:hypothetical protein
MLWMFGHGIIRPFNDSAIGYSMMAFGEELSLPGSPTLEGRELVIRGAGGRLENAGKRWANRGNALEKAVVKVRLRAHHNSLDLTDADLS